MIASAQSWVRPFWRVVWTKCPWKKDAWGEFVTSRSSMATHT